MNQFFYDMLTTTWALKHVLFVIDYKVLTMHGEEKQRPLGSMHRFQKKPKVAPKRGLITLAVNIQSNMANEEEKSISLLMIFPASV